MAKLKWTTAMPDWERRIVAGESIIPVAPLYPDMANKAEQFFSRLVLRDVIGMPSIGDVTRLWVYQFAAAIFGSQNPDTFRREINDFFLLISKKNSKSTIAAAIMLTALYLDGQSGVRESSEYLILAPTKEVADNSFIPAKDMIRSDPELSTMFNVSPHTRTITDVLTGSTLKVVAADDRTVGGKKATGVLIDELHLFGSMAGADAMISEATGGLLSRIDGFVIKLSTQSTEPPAGVFKSELELARQVRDGEIDIPNYMPVLYEFPQEMIDSGAYKESKNFYVTNPNLGASVDEQQLLTKLGQATAKGEVALKEFFAKHLNIEVGLNLRADRWPGADFWLPQKSKLYFDDLMNDSEVVVMGADGGGLDDLLGEFAIGRHKKTQDWLLWGHAYCDPIVLERRKDIADRLLDFEQAGDLTFVEGANRDCQYFAETVKTLLDADLLHGIGFDPLMVGGLVTAVEDAVQDEDLCNEICLKVHLANQVALGANVLAKRLRYNAAWHGGQALIDWCVSNTKVIAKEKSFVVTKQVAGSAKIDPVIAMFNAAFLMSTNPTPRNMLGDFTSKMIMVGV